MHIAYVGPFAFPGSDANSLRVRGVVQLLRECGSEVTVFPGFCTPECRSAEHAPPLDVVCTHEYYGGFFSGWKKGLRGLFLGDRLIDVLSQAKKPDIVIVYGAHLGYLGRLIQFCRVCNIKLVVDSVEWYDPKSLPGGRFGPFALTNELSMRYFVKRADGVIAVSRLLESHFKRQGCETIRIPPLFALEAYRPEQFKSKNQRLNLCYAGAPGKKEDLRSLFGGLQAAFEAGVDLCTHIVGLERDDVVRAFGRTFGVIEMDEVVKFYGRVENVFARRVVAASDFVVVLRGAAKVVNAGFPSKVAESLSLGTPVIANLFSNLDEYLEDGKNAIIVAECSAAAFASAIGRAATLTSPELLEMQANSRDTAFASFAADAHRSQMSNFLFKVKRDV